MPRRGEFRAFTDQMLEYIDRLRAAEDHKRSVQVGSAEFLTAAEEAAELSRLSFRWAQMQLEMAHAVQRQENGVSPEVRLINVEPRPLDKVLAHWREAQLRLEIARPGSPQAEEAVRDIERLRDEYQAGHDAQIEAGAARLADPRDTT
jgi:urease beta subunit